MASADSWRIRGIEGVETMEPVLDRRLLWMGDDLVLVPVWRSFGDVWELDVWVRGVGCLGSYTHCLKLKPEARGEHFTSQLLMGSCLFVKLVCSVHLRGKGNRFLIQEFNCIFIASGKASKITDEKVWPH